MDGSKANKSFLSYSITRRYPNARYDWAFATCVVVCTILFSFLNLAVNGYNMQTIYTTDPNATVAHHEWFEKVPFSWFNSFTPSCQGASLTTGNTYFTTNLGLIYTLSKVSQGQANGPVTPLPAVSYWNTTLHDCTVDLIDIQMERKEYSATNLYASNFWTWDTSYASAEAVCNVIADSQTYTVKWMVTLPTVRKACNDALLDYFVLLDNKTQPSVWWGAQLINVYYQNLAEAVATNEAYVDGSRIDNVQFQLWPNRSSDITSLDFFSANGLLYPNLNGSFYDASPNNDNLALKDWQAYANDQYLAPFANLTLNLDAFGKALYSTILSDLGQSAKSNALSTNASTTADAGIQYLLTVLDQIPPASGGTFNGTILNPGIAQSTAYDELKSQVPLEIKPATIFLQYACSVPKRKSTAALLVSIFIADAVLLQVAWKAMNFIATRLAEREDRKAYWCQGCVAWGDSRAVDQATRPLLTASVSSMSIGESVSKERSLQ